MTEKEYKDAVAKIIERLFTKDEVVDILTDIQLEIEEIKPLEPTDNEDYAHGCFHGLELMQDKCLKIIQEKINTLGGNENA